jgi:DNA-binding beta-propeller fold protein YncE
MFECSGIIFSSQFGEKWTDNGQFYAPHSMIVDSLNNLYVFDSLNNRIQIFNPQWKYIRKIDNFILKNALYIEFSDMDIDQSGNIYTVEPYKVKKFDSLWKILLEFGANWINNGQFNMAQGMPLLRMVKYM